jgi:hypothetical protein
MKFYNLIIKYRPHLAIAFLIIGIAANVYAGFWPAFLPYLIAVILLFGYFFFGPLRLIQEHMESGDMEAAEKVLSSVKYPGLLYKPIRSVYYTLKGNIAMMKQDFDGAEKNMKKGLDLGMPMKEAEGASLLQMGMLSMQRNDIRQGESYIRQAIRKGLPDKENQPAALFHHDDQAGVPRRQGFLPQSQGVETHHSTDRQPDQRDRKVYQQDPRVMRGKLALLQRYWPKGEKEPD